MKKSLLVLGLGLTVVGTGMLVKKVKNKIELRKCTNIVIDQLREYAKQVDKK